MGCDPIDRGYPKEEGVNINAALTILGAAATDELKDIHGPLNISQ